MKQTGRSLIQVYRDDPAARGDRLAAVDPPVGEAAGPWGFRLQGPAPEAARYAPGTPEFLYWELAFALDRGKRMWTRLAPRPGTWTPGAVLPAIPVAGEDFNAFYDRKALNFFRGVDPKTKAVVYSGESPDVSTHEQGHAILDAMRPDLWNAPHFEVAAFHEAFGDLAAIFAALTEPVLDADVVSATRADPARSNLVSRLAEELGRAVRDADGPDAAPPGALRDAVNAFRYEDPTKLPDSAPATSLSAEPHSFCRVMTGAAWDILVALFRSAPGRDRAAALGAAAERAARICVAAADTAPSGADFFGRVARRLVRETAAREGTAAARTVGELLVKRRLLDVPDVPAELSRDEDPGLSVPPDDATGNVALARTVAARLPPAEGAVLVRGTRGALAERGAGLRVLRGRRRRDLRLSGREFGPADGACVEIADSFALGFNGGGFLRASRVHPADDRDVEDAKAFVRFLVRRRRIAEVAGFAPDSLALARERKTHAVVRDPDGVRRLKRIWIARREAP